MGKRLRSGGGDGDDARVSPQNITCLDSYHEVECSTTDVKRVTNADHSFFKVYVHASCTGKKESVFAVDSSPESEYRGQVVERKFAEELDGRFVGMLPFSLFDNPGIIPKGCFLGQLGGSNDQGNTFSVTQEQEEWVNGILRHAPTPP